MMEETREDECPVKDSGLYPGDREQLLEQIGA